MSWLVDRMLTSASLFLVSAVNQFVSAADPVVMEDASDEYEDDGVFEFGAKALAPAIRLKAEKSDLLLYIMIFKIEVRTVKFSVVNQRIKSAGVCVVLLRRCVVFRVA